MLKKIIIFVLALLLIIVVAVVYNKDVIVKKGIAHYGSAALGVPVKVGSVSLEVMKGSGSIKNLIVSNPKGYKSEYAMKLSQIDFSVDPNTLYSNHIVVNKIIINGLSVNIEAQHHGSNILQLKKNLHGYLESDQSSLNNDSKSTAKSDNKAGIKGSGANISRDKRHKTVTIGLLSLSNAQVKGALSGSQKTIKIKNLTLRDIGKNKPLLIAQVIEIVLNKVMADVAHQSIEAVAQSFLEKQLGKIGGGAKSAAGAVGDAGATVASKLGGALHKLVA